MMANGDKTTSFLVLEKKEKISVSVSLTYMHATPKAAQFLFQVTCNAHK